MAEKRLSTVSITFSIPDSIIPKIGNLTIKTNWEKTVWYDYERYKYYTDSKLKEQLEKIFASGGSILIKQAMIDPVWQKYKKFWPNSKIIKDKIVEKENKDELTAKIITAIKRTIEIIEINPKIEKQEISIYVNIDTSNLSYGYHVNDNIFDSWMINCINIITIETIKIVYEKVKDTINKEIMEVINPENIKKVSYSRTSSSSGHTACSLQQVNKQIFQEIIN